MIRFLADADFNHAIVKGCRRHEPAMDFLSANEAKLDGLPDPDLLALAAEQDRILPLLPGIVPGEPASADWGGNRSTPAHLGGIGCRRMDEPHCKHSRTVKSRPNGIVATDPRVLTDSGQLTTGGT